MGEGRHHGLAHSPPGYNIMDHAPALGWQEWDKVARKWLVRPQAGVRTRGKVRPRSSSPCSSFTVRTTLTSAAEPSSCASTRDSQDRTDNTLNLEESACQDAIYYHGQERPWNS